MVLIVLVSFIIPANEFLVYETNDKGKIGHIEITSHKDSLGYHVVYTSDRTIYSTLDSLDFGTKYLEKIINNKLVLKIIRGERFMVYYQGRKFDYHADGPIYDRHTLDFALRQFQYHKDFQTKIRLHIPELMIVNADLKVVGEEIITTPLGEFLCWKIEMAPRIFLTHRKLYFWFEKNYPYRFIKFVDPSSGNYIMMIESQIYD